MKSRSAFRPSLFLVLLIISGAGLHQFTGSEVRYEVRVIPAKQSLSGRPLRVVYVLPKGTEDFAERSRPAVIAAPPYSIAPEAMEIICVELARRGAACAIPDFFGKSPEESRQRMGDDALEIMKRDMLSIAADLHRRFPWLDPDKFGICGHSVGGRVAIDTAIAEPRFRSCAPIGMEFGFEADAPKNLLFIAGLYDEIHYPNSLIENLRRHGAAPEPEIDTLYGSHQDGTARKLVIIPTADHFIETFDYWLIRDLLEWFALSFDEPALGEGLLAEWWRRVAAFIFTLAAAGLWVSLMGRIAEKAATRLSARAPAWLLSRIAAIPVLFLLAAILIMGRTEPELRLVAIYLLVALPLAQEAVNYGVRGALRHPGRSPFRTLRSALLIGLALGAGTLLSFGLVCANYYLKWPGFLLWYPVFFANMALLFPLEVWGRSMPMFFNETVTGLSPGRGWFILVGLVTIFPGQLIRLVDRIASELVISVRARLKPLALNGETGGRDPMVATDERTGGKPVGVISPLKVGLLVALAALLGFLVYRRIVEGMLTPETAWLALLSILRFAVLPFLIAALIVRTRRFRVWSNLA